MHSKQSWWCKNCTWVNHLKDLQCLICKAPRCKNAHCKSNLPHETFKIKNGFCTKCGTPQHNRICARCSESFDEPVPTSLCSKCRVRVPSTNAVAPHFSSNRSLNSLPLDFQRHFLGFVNPFQMAPVSRLWNQEANKEKLYVQLLKENFNIDEKAAPLARYKNLFEKYNCFAAGNMHILFLCGNGAVWGFGESRGGRLGEFTSANASIYDLQNMGRVIPQQFTTFRKLNKDGSLSDVGIVPAKAIAAHRYASFILGQDGYVYACGYENDENLDYGWLPTQIPVLKDVTCMAVADNYSVFGCRDGRLFEWDHRCGDRPIGSPPLQEVPQEIARFEKNSIKALSTSGNHSLCLLGDGTIHGWGSNQHGELGLGHSEDVESPTLIPCAKKVIAVAAGGSPNVLLDTLHSLVLFADQTVSICGSLEYCNLCQPSNRYRNYSVFTPIPNLKNVKAISTSNGMSMFLLEGGRVQVFGRGKAELGLGTRAENSSRLAFIEDLNNVQAIYAGYTGAFSLALQDGNLYFFGNNSGSFSASGENPIDFRLVDIGPIHGHDSVVAVPTPIPGLPFLTGAAASASAARSSSSSSVSSHSASAGAAVGEWFCNRCTAVNQFPAFQCFICGHNLLP